MTVLDRVPGPDEQQRDFALVRARISGARLTNSGTLWRSARDHELLEHPHHALARARGDPDAFEAL